jgi:terpene synthase-like protein
MPIGLVPAFLRLDQYRLPEHRYAGICPYADRIRAEYASWCAGMSHLSNVSRRRYQQQNLSYAASRCFPHPISYEHARACALHLFWMTLFDDYHELCGATELAVKRDRIVAILRGGPPLIGEHPLLSTISDFRKLATSLMTTEWLDRYIATVEDYFRMGVAPESEIRRERRLPSFAELVEFRPYSIAMFPYFLMVETQLDCAPPSEVITHPRVQRIKCLLARIAVWQNDVFSLMKEMSQPTADAEVINLALVLRQERCLSLQDACAAMLQVYQADVAEFRELSDELPNFGPHQRAAEHYVHHLAITASGLETWYRTDTGRYAVNGTWAGEHAPSTSR